LLVQCSNIILKRWPRVGLLIIWDSFS